MGRRNGPRRNPKGLFGTPGDVVYRAVGVSKNEQEGFESYMRLAYSVAAAVVAALAAVMVLSPMIGGTGTTIAAVIAGSWAFIATAKRVQRPLI